MTSPWIQTVSGRAFDLLAPLAEDVDVADIAHALSRINRFSGHTHGEPYSVAHHSMLVADLLASWGAPPAIVREGLLHDAGEAYYGDLTSPVKRAMREHVAPHLARFTSSETGEHVAVVRDVVGTFMAPIDRVVRSALMLPEHETPLVKRADLVALAIERRDLFGGVEEPRGWALPEFAPTSPPCGRIMGRFSSTLALAPSERRRIDAADLCTWDTARDRFLALLAALDAKWPGDRDAEAAS